MTADELRVAVAKVIEPEFDMDTHSNPMMEQHKRIINAKALVRADAAIALAMAEVIRAAEALEEPIEGGDYNFGWETGRDSVVAAARALVKP